MPEPALAPRLSRRDLKNAGDSEEALTILANALESIPGAKTCFLLGWGLGQRTQVGVRMKSHWRKTLASLTAARVTMFSLRRSKLPPCASAPSCSCCSWPSSPGR